MTFWEFVDKQLDRLNPAGVAGAGIFILTGAVLAMLKDTPELADNDLFKTLAQSIVVQGLVGLAMAAWFTKRSDDQPTRTEIVNTPESPAQVHDVGEDQ